MPKMLTLKMYFWITSAVKRLQTLLRREFLKAEAENTLSGFALDRF